MLSKCSGNYSTRFEYQTSYHIVLNVMPEKIPSFPFKLSQGADFWNVRKDLNLWCFIFKSCLVLIEQWIRNEADHRETWLWNEVSSSRCNFDALGKSGGQLCLPLPVDCGPCSEPLLSCMRAFSCPALFFPCLLWSPVTEMPLLWCWEQRLNAALQTRSMLL